MNVKHRPRVLLADDHPRVAEAIGEYVAEAFQLVATVRDGDALLQSAKSLRPDVIIADISMPGIDGLSAMKEIRRQFPEIKVILLTSFGDPSLARYALQAGAAGFVVKAYAPTELVDAIRAVVAGATYVSGAIAV
jgi:DNA-binding NarL/FixJ family response regulator